MENKEFLKCDICEKDIANNDRCYNCSIKIRSAIEKIKREFVKERETNVVREKYYDFVKEIEKVFMKYGIRLVLYDNARDNDFTYPKGMCLTRCDELCGILSKNK